MKRLTVFLGAGATIDIGGLTTMEITRYVRELDHQVGNERLKLIDVVAEELKKYYNGVEVNFEEIFHVFELLNSYSLGFQHNRIKDYMPHICAFLKPNHDIWRHEYFWSAQRKIIEGVWGKVARYDAQCLSAENNWHVKFWRELREINPLDIGTLNYDTCIEQIFNKQIEDGYEKSGIDYYRFNPKKIHESTNSRIFHLHGCIHYGFFEHFNEEVKRFSEEDDLNDLYKFDLPSRNFSLNPMRVQGKSQSGMELFNSPLLTGLNKADKLFKVPFSYYYNAFQSSVLENSSLLIIGYSFGDIHFNSIFQRMKRLHGDKRRIVVIGFHSKSEWGLDYFLANMKLLNMYDKFLEKQEFDNFGRIPKVLEEEKTLIESDDGSVRIYMGGFKMTVENHKDEIIDFLNS